MQYLESGPFTARVQDVVFIIIGRLVGQILICQNKREIKRFVGSRSVLQPVHFLQQNTFLDRVH
jgi:hypothetical protein